MRASDEGREIRRVLSASSLASDRIRNRQGEELGDLKELMIDLDRGKVAYAVVSFGGFLGIGEKLFAVPWTALEVDQVNRELVLDMDRQRLESMEGFDPDNWPDFTAPDFGQRTHAAYGAAPYWES